ncbi:PucR family transcriptional regulator [Actinoallomurus sp. CA-150999]|uniref:PucR family transcriptional regulator n=1 Tax=Actinoallomurus sp. CA-150999 TaxID=3239887 RepID=UPI003D8E9882
MAVLPDPPAGLARWDQVSGVRSLLVLSMVMAETDDQGHILDLAVTSVPTLGRCRSHGAFLIDIGWHDVRDAVAEGRAHDDLEVQLAVLTAAGGPVAVPGEGWAWAYPLRSLDDHLGYLVVGAAKEPSSDAQFLMRILAQQAGIAIAHARRRVCQRADAEQLRIANTALAETVAALECETDIHERLMTVAAAGAGPAGIAEALHELTGYSIAVEDRQGNLRAWAGSGRPDPYPEEEHASREEVLRTAARAAWPIRRRDRVIMPAGPSGHVLGALVLLDPDGGAGRSEFSALQQAATVLTAQLVHLNKLAAADRHLSDELVDGLISGADLRAVLARAEALGYDLRRPHRAVVVAASSSDTADEEFLRAVRNAAHDTGVGSLVALRSRDIVVFSDADRSWSHFRTAIRRGLGGGDCRIGVGGEYREPAYFSRSCHEAQMALRLQSVSGYEAHIVEFDRLGAYRLLTEIEDQTGVERFVREWLGALLDYDDDRGTALVPTLSRYLQYGRGYTATTTALAIHRSTLKYRIHRISEISGHDLGDPDVCFNLQLATRAWQVLRALRAEPDR